MVVFYAVLKVACTMSCKYQALIISCSQPPLKFVIHINPNLIISKDIDPLHYLESCPNFKTPCIQLYTQITKCRERKTKLVATNLSLYWFNSQNAFHGLSRFIFWLKGGLVFFVWFFCVCVCFFLNVYAKDQ